ncbi:MAG: hypothetical protein ABFD89_01530 [Bryobacteraceae bacterium]
MGKENKGLIGRGDIGVSWKQDVLDGLRIEQCFAGLKINNSMTATCEVTQRFREMIEAELREQVWRDIYGPLQERFLELISIMRHQYEKTPVGTTRNYTFRHSINPECYQRICDLLGECEKLFNDAEAAPDARLMGSMETGHEV